MKREAKSKALRISAATCGFLIGPLLALTLWSDGYKSLVCSAIGGTTSKIIKDESNTEDTEYFKTNGKSLEDWIDEESKLIEKVQGEGSVLLRNENGALPLAKGSKVSTFGYGTIKPITTGMVRFGTPGTSIDFKTGMEKDGNLSINPTLYDFYAQHSTQDLAFNTVNEVDAGLIDTGIRSTYDTYGDAAIVVISRAGGEGGDLATGDFTGGSKYLALQESERKMLQEVTSHFDKVIVLLNTSYAMELGWLEEFDIDACLMVGAIGYSGFNAISDILVGNVNPSGRTVDTYAYDSFSSPAMTNFGDYTFSNADQIVSTIGGDASVANFGKYVVEKEGIYVGYKYYETRYEDQVLGKGNATSSAGAFKGTNWDYDKEVAYPFGHGLSYTTFEEKLSGVVDNGETFTVNVEVTNTGDVAGRHVVQVYAQTPYTQFDRDNGIEAAAIQLVGFSKTAELDPDEEATLQIEVDKEDLCHYDAVVNKTFILEAGDYYLTVGDDAHAAIQNVLQEKGKDVGGNAELVYDFHVGQTDTTTYAVTEDNVRITNQFDNADLNYYEEGSVTYLSRSDWQKTWPTEQTTLEANAAMIEDLDTEGSYEAGSSDLSGITTGADTEYTIAMMIGRPFDDEAWDAILDQMTIEDYVTLTARSGLAPIDHIGYPTVFMKDGSHRVTDRTYVGTDQYALIFPSAVIMASTYDRDLLYEIGKAYGEDNIRTETVGHYAPGVNIHRTPYSGRNFEYYSEDGYLTGEMAVGSIRGMQEKGAIPYIKHLALNEQETNRNGVSTFVNQQAIREIYLEGFKAGIVEGGAKGIMGSFNRVGCTWSNAHGGLVSEVVRNEWNFTGIIDTDAVFGYNSYMSYLAGIDAGTTMWATSGTGIYDAVIDAVKKDRNLVEKAREASHYLLYNVVNSLALNGISSTDRVVSVMPWWQITLIVIDVVLGVGALASLGILAYVDLRKGKEELSNEQN